MKKYEIEISRHNVTPAQFLAYVRAQLKKKGLRDISSDLDLDYFRRGNDLNSYYYNDPEKPCKSEKSVSRPYEMQTYVLNWDGTCYNEICEFEFDDEKTGHGYYYLLNTVEEETEEEAIEEAAEVEEDDTVKLIEGHYYRFNDRGSEYIGYYYGRQKGFECCVCGKGSNAFTFNIWYGDFDYETWGYGKEHMPQIIEDLGESDTPIINK